MNYKYLLLVIMVMYTLAIGFAYLGKDHPPQPPDHITVRMCREYAQKDHEKEFTPERWEMIKDLWNEEQWYASCVNHSTGGWYTYTYGNTVNSR